MRESEIKGERKEGINKGRTTKANKKVSKGERRKLWKVSEDEVRDGSE